MGILEAGKGHLSLYFPQLFTPVPIIGWPQSEILIPDFHKKEAGWPRDQGVLGAPTTGALGDKLFSKKKGESGIQKAFIITVTWYPLEENTV